MDGEIQSNKFSKACLALSTDFNSSNLVTSAESFCRATGLKLDLISILDTPITLPYGSFTDHMSITDFDAESRTMFNEDQRSYRLILNDYLNILGGDVKGSSDVLMGDVTEEILNYIQRQKIDVLIIGVSADEKHKRKHLFSKTYKLMSRAKIPVLIMPIEKSYNFTEDVHRILLADDLETTDKAVNFSVFLSYYLRKLDILHANVLMKTDGLYLTFGPHLMVSGADLMTSSDVFDYLEKQKSQETLQLLNERSAEMMDILDKNEGHYNPCVAEGNVDEQLEHLAEDFHADIAIYGTSQPNSWNFFHHKNLPHWKKLNKERITILVPR